MYGIFDFDLTIVTILCSVTFVDKTILLLIVWTPGRVAIAKITTNK